MAKLYYNCPGGAFGDCMPFEKDGVFYLYYLKDNRKPQDQKDPFVWDLVTTPDFVHYTEQGTAIAGSGPNHQDQDIISGSVMEGMGQYHAFYTGAQPDSGCTGECRHGNRGSKDRKRQRKCCGRRNHIDCVGTIYRIRRRCAA